ncbi:DUF1752-domain-containing protein [Periconia macrospinosa]|uniref:DUF1752-domain-containing protein n=1 Tax=Periconia macrospinosa TaxID=97972 RepID=A0A2V1D771_9PLEO|nr:DUF1752-domain-containing protein [Periconia macrospinosa]
MPLHADRPIVRVEHDSMRSIEIRNPENLFGLWSVFSKCSPVLQDGRRYENIAWRLWGRETQCCLPEHADAPEWSLERSTSEDPPELSTSVASDDSVSATTSNCSSRPDLRRHDSANSQARSKHITPIDLEKVVNSIQEKRTIEPLSPLPAQLAPPSTEEPDIATEEKTPRRASPSPPITAARFIQDSTSTVATTMVTDTASPTVGSEISTSTDLSSHSVVHGFAPGKVSTSIRSSSTNLNPTPILKSSFIPRPPPSKAEPVKKKQPMFTLGGSSDEDNSSSFEAYSMTKRSSLSDNLRRSGLINKTTSFKNEIATRTIHDAMSEESEAMESAIESESDEESDENAIEEDESDEGDWEDDNEESMPPSEDEKPMFQRVDSKPNLVSRRSLLTTMMHQGDRAQALQNAASRSQPAIRRSRTSTPNGPSTGNSPQEDGGLMMRQQASRARPIIMTTSNVHPPMLSPRTTRRNMLQTELTQSLRQNLLWERQQKNSAINAVNKRVQSAASIPALRRAMTTNDIKGMEAQADRNHIQNMTKSSTIYKDTSKNNSSFNDYFDQGLQEYHQKGW